MRRLLLIVGILGFSTTAFAGYKWGQPVTIDTTARSATGTMGTARATADSVQYLECAASAGTSNVVAQCWARDAAGTTVACRSFNNYIFSALAAINSDSRITFTWDATGTCTTVSVQTGSSYQPKTP
jgi:hypothetical protein